METTSITMMGQTWMRDLRMMLSGSAVGTG